MAITDHKYIEGTGLLIENGDLAVIESEQDHIKDIVLDNKGEWKQNPLVGVGALNFLNSTVDLDDIKKKIQTQLENDKFKVQEITRLIDGSFRIIAKRNENATS